jgi:GNAT superfamily N-acetyltransferase
MIREWTVEEAVSDNRVAVFMNMFMQASGEIKLETDYTHDKYKELVRQGICKILIAEENGVLQGTIGIMFANDMHENKKMAIEVFWFVDPAYRGIGKALFTAFEEEAKKMGCKKLACVHMIDSYPDTLKVFYEKQGYHLAELHYIKEVS